MARGGVLMPRPRRAISRPSRRAVDAGLAEREAVGAEGGELAEVLSRVEALHRCLRVELRLVRPRRACVVGRCSGGRVGFGAKSKPRSSLSDAAGGPCQGGPLASRRGQTRSTGPRRTDRRDVQDAAHVAVGARLGDELRVPAHDGAGGGSVAPSSRGMPEHAAVLRRAGGRAHIVSEFLPPLECCSWLRMSASS